MKSNHKSEGKKLTKSVGLGVLALGSLGILTAYYIAGCQSQPPVKQMTQAEIVERGSYLVTSGHCNDCHTPWIMGAKGPEPDMSRLLSGHPQDLKMPTINLPQEPWQVVVSATLTAWHGPWGTSFTANLTPDTMTGLGSWTAEMFIQAMRIGKHMGQPGSWDIKPPMPWYNLAKMTDEDLKAIFAYLQSIPAIRNKVPDHIPPAAVQK
ncbi:MAG: hypothetical protein A2V86_14575 [Deltaproteobacteria bacterium RBG_16_49_23]|nr:MAG: hypothetical protein A2V86_14575 [Deltaproteobacteria bacterium RBG_16_49_23]